MRTTTTTGEAVIWTRDIQPENNGLSPDAARSLLAIQFSQADRARMLELAAKSNEGLLSAAEREEFEGYVKVGDVLSLLHLKAKRSLKK